MSKLIKMKLLDLGRKQVDLMAELERRGITTSPPELSNSINGNLNTPKGSRIRQECLYILDEWEKRGKGARA